MTEPTSAPAVTSIMDGVGNIPSTTPTIAGNSVLPPAEENIDVELPSGLISNRTYDILKWVSIIVMPALATFIVGLGGIWSLPYAGQAAATVTTIGVLLGALLGLSSVAYNSSKASATTTTTTAD